MARNLTRFLQPSTVRERAVRGLKPLPPDNLPARLGPVEFSILGGMIAVRYPQDLMPLVRKAGGTWEPGSRRWLVEPRRIGPLLRNLRRATDPLFRQAGINLDRDA